MISQQEFTARLIAHLDATGVPSMLCGSVASSFHGEPRATKDIDVVIECTPDQLHVLLQRFRDAGWYVSDAAARDALKRRAMFNVIDPESGWKADLMLRKDRAFSRSEFNRRQMTAFPGGGGATMALTTPEDTILSKLEWSLAASSEQQFRDALHVAIIGGETIDRDYLRKWAPELGVADLLERLLSQADQWRATL